MAHRALAPERQRGVPFALVWSSTPLQSIERMPVDRGRNLRVYAFYYGLFWPLIAAPLAAGFTYLVWRHFNIAAWQFWTAMAVYFVWGICVIALERRVMGPPWAR